MTTKDQAALAKLYTESFGGEMENGDSNGLDIDSIYNQLEDIMFKLENSGMYKNENAEMYGHMKAVMDMLAKNLPASKFHNTYDLDRQ